MSDSKKVTGPASYFPSIEKKYGQPIDHWIELVKKQKGMKHMKIVIYLLLWGVLTGLSLVS
jgi:hypothetical protein